MIVIDTVDACKAAVEELLRSQVVAVDLEGIDLGRHPGRVCIMQVFADKTVYLFDITTLQNVDGFGEGRLAELLESRATQKVLWDVRADCDALHHVRADCDACELTVTR